MRVAIVGSRGFYKHDDVRDFVEDLPDDTLVVSGGAAGVDWIAETYARKRNLKVHIFPAEWSLLGKGAGFIRNQVIVDNSDMVIAFWDGGSRGTMDTIRRAVKAGKCPVIYT